MEYGQYGRDRFLFVGSERSNVIAVYRIILGRPKLVQVLPAGMGPEGVLAIPSRGLSVVTSEVDDAEANIRSTITIYALEGGRPRYPTIRSANRADGLPIPWGDETVDLDLEGIAQRPDCGFWAVSEGAGSVDDPGRPVSSLNLLIKTTRGAAIIAEIRWLGRTVGAGRPGRGDLCRDRAR